MRKGIGDDIMINGKRYMFIRSGWFLEGKVELQQLARGFREKEFSARVIQDSKHKSLYGLYIEA